MSAEAKLKALDKELADNTINAYIHVCNGLNDIANQYGGEIQAEYDDFSDRYNADNRPTFSNLKHEISDLLYIA